MNQGNRAISADSILTRNPKVTYRDLEEGGVLLDLETGAYHGLNSTGSAIWKLLERDLTCAEVVDEFTKALDDVPPGVETEVTAFITGMLDRGLVRLRGS